MPRKMTVHFERPLSDAWKDRARCREIEDTDSLWFPDSRVATGITNGICAQCPVRKLCFSEGMHQSDGTWGGVAAKARRFMREGKLPIPEEML